MPWGLTFNEEHLKWTRTRDEPFSVVALTSLFSLSSGHGIWITNWTTQLLCSLLTHPPQCSASYPFPYRLRLCPQSCLNARSCVHWIWETTACRRCRHASESSLGWPSWSWEGTVLSVSQWSLGSVACWRGAVWWWRRTSSTRCHQRSKSSYGGPIRSKLEAKLSRGLQSQVIGEIIKELFNFKRQTNLELLQPWWLCRLRQVLFSQSWHFSAWTCKIMEVVQLSRPPRMSFWKFAKKKKKENLITELGDERWCSRGFSVLLSWM